MGIGIELGEDQVWHMMINEQLDVPFNLDNDYVVETFAFLLRNRIIFNVVYSDFGIHIQLNNVEYVAKEGKDIVVLAKKIVDFKSALLQRTNKLEEEALRDYQEEAIKKATKRKEEVYEGRNDEIYQDEVVDNLKEEHPVESYPTYKPKDVEVEKSSLKQPPINK